ncbi:MAG TPA: AAA family ATPase, partial [Thermoanaerobaculia bacterium]|nr:AAA family ATPase [Thermoanaerobaculia bacterium]
MTAPARLLSVRLQGFKSFAERTHVTFGPGISAIVGPNGSGKSNLADALRWALGEQGRALRSRRSEDVIWAGSERRPALGMADVQLTLDNADGLLPVEYGVVELGRRLFRSGENDYLLNRQRVRLRDLVDLLDGAHLSENAFLFIGQGMVDQALALRPEERRPLFEEVAGVRRPERRRRRAEEQLAEAEANLARVEDILGELRPQARRLSQQAEQQTSRRSAADELAEAILLAAHARWHEAARRVAEATSAEARARGVADRAMADLTMHEGAAGEVAARLAGRVREEAERRAVVDRERETLTTFRLREGRLSAEREGLDRERTRLAAEREAAETELAAAREVLAVAPAPIAIDGHGLTTIEAELAAARDELASLGAGGRADPDAATLRRLVAVRTAEHEAAARRAAEAERVAIEERSRATAQARQAEGAGAARAERAEELRAAISTELSVRAAREVAQARRDEAEAERRLAVDRASATHASLAAAEARAEEARRHSEADDGDAFRAAASAGGGQPVDRDLIVEPPLAVAVDAALAELGRAVVIGRDAILPLLEQRGLAIVAEALEKPESPRPRERRDTAEAAFLAEVERHGGGLLRDAVRRDGSGAARRLLARAAWLPDAATCLELQAAMPPGWIMVAADGSLVVRALTASIRPDGGSIRRRSELERQVAVAAEAKSAAAAADQALSAATVAADAAGQDLAAAQAAETAATAARRRLEEEERTAAAAATSAAREAAWLAAQAERLEQQAERLRADAADRASAIPVVTASSDDAAGADARGALERQVRELGARRDRLAAEAAAATAARAEVERHRTRAEAAAALAERRRDELDRALAALAERDAALGAERAAVAGSIAAAARSLGAAETALQAVLGEGAADRDQLQAAEAAAASTREAVRGA